MTEFSKSELFELSAEMSSDSTQLSIGPLEFSNFDFDDDMEQMKLKKVKARKQEIELKQLQHDLQLSRIQLAQKDYELNNLRVEYTTKIESLEEKVHELTHQNQLLSTRLQSIVNIHQEEEKQRQEQVKVELSRILVRQKELEENNERFMKNDRELKRELRNIDTVIWTNEEYEFMCRRDEDLMTIKEYATLKLYNCIRPLKQKLDECYKQIQTLDEQLKQEKSETARLKQIYDQEKKTHNVNSMDNQKLYYELADTKAQLQQANFKRDNYDRLKYERDDLERKYSDAETRNSKHLATIQVITNERDDLLKEMNNLKQEISLLRHDKDYLQKQFVEAQARFKIAEDKLDQTEKLYEDAKRSKEDLYEKHMNTRDQIKNEYDSRLSLELDELKQKTAQEIEKLRTSTKEFYEREIQTLREAKDALTQDKEKLELNEKEIQLKYQEAVNELRVVQLTCENKASELKSELKLKMFELERTELLNEESINNYKKALIENEKLHKKIEIIQNEYHSLQIQNEKRFMEVENELNEKKARLESYEKVEQEMDNVIRQVAESSESGNINETEAEKLLLSYGYGANMMLNAKKRVQQNVHLTKRILHLEQLNTTLRFELNKERNRMNELNDQLEIAKNVIENTKQPHEFLVRSIQVKETQLKKQQVTIDLLQKKIDEISTDKENSVRKQNEMAADIEKLLRHNEELIAIRDELKKKGLLINNKRFANSNVLASKSNEILAINTPIADQPKALMFTSKLNRSRHPTSPNQRFQRKLKSKSPVNPTQTVYAIDKD